MDDNARKRLDEQGTIILSGDIDDEHYEMMVEAMLIVGDRPLKLYCHGLGGSAPTAIAIAGLIQQHGNTIGFLPGNACSSHATIFASCEQRYIYPMASFSVHMVALYAIDERVDAKFLARKLADFERFDRLAAEIYAAASNKPVEFWRGLIDTVSGESVTIAYEQMIAYELARPVSEFGRTVERVFAGKNGHESG